MTTCNLAAVISAVPAALDYAAEALKDGAVLAEGVPVSEGAVDFVKTAAAQGAVYSNIILDPKNPAG
jgi:hypothetical protein